MDMTNKEMDMYCFIIEILNQRDNCKQVIN